MSKEAQKKEKEKSAEKEEDLEEKEDEKEDQPVETTPNANNQSKSAKPKKIVYLNQKVILPNNLTDRMEYIRNLFYNEELGYTVNYAPLYHSSSVYEVGKYFKSKQKKII